MNYCTGDCSTVKEYVEKVAADVACINGMENAPEIMAEYKLCGSLAVAINSVSQRKDRIPPHGYTNTRGTNRS